MSEYRLHDYQEEARDFLRNRKRAALFLDMGLGKTASTLHALDETNLPALVVAPKKVAENTWQEERDKFRPDLSISVARGDKDKRMAALDTDADVTVISRDNCADVLEMWKHHPYRTFIVDELSGYKSRSSNRWKVADKISRGREAENVWGLTGTPAPNGYIDLWAQVALLDRGERLGKNITAYRSRYFMPGQTGPNGVVYEWLIRPESERNIKKKIEDICLYMSGEGRIKLPSVTENQIHVELPPAVRKAYLDLQKNLAVDLREIFGGEKHTAASAGVLSSRLSQISAGFLYVDEAEYHEYSYTRLHTEKTKTVRDIVEEAQGSGVLVFYRFQAELEMLKKELKAYGPRSVNEEGIISEWNKGEVRVLLAHPASAGHGLNLQHGGHTIVWSTLPWSLEEWQQGNGRLARQGQKHPVVIHVLLGTLGKKGSKVLKTIDFRTRARLDEKEAVQEDLLAYLESPI